MQEDALIHHWDPSTFVNPPYGPSIKKWVRKAHDESVRGCCVVMLLPSRTDTEWFHQYCLSPGVEIRFLKGRLKFGDGNGRCPFPSIIVIFRPPIMTKSIDQRNEIQDNTCLTSKEVA
jgi:hypothetical protein